MKKILSLVLVIFLLCSSMAAFAEIDWSAMTEEEIKNAILEAYEELSVRNKDQLNLGEPKLIKNDYGEYSFAIDGAHVLSSDKWMNSAKKRGEDSIFISVQGVVENIDCNWLGDYDYIPNYQIQKDMITADQDGFSLEIYDISGGDDGRYEVGAKTCVGEKRRVSLVFYAFSDTKSVTVSFKGYPGSITIPLDQ